MTELSLDGVGRVFGTRTPVQALSEVSLDIAQGEFVAIEGPSGGGKSTLLNILGLLDTPSTGSYLIDGQVISSTDKATLARYRSKMFAFIFQSFHLLDRRPAIESVELGLLYRGVPARERRRRAREAMESVGIGHLADSKAHLLSGGERQRVAVARALAAGAQIVVADEPTGSLDSVNSGVVLDSLEKLNELGATVILVTYDPNIAARARRRIRILDGHVFADKKRGGAHALGVPTTPEALRKVSSGVSSRASLAVSLEAASGESAGLSEEAPSHVSLGRPATLAFRDMVVDAFRVVVSKVGKTMGLAAAVALGVALAVSTLGISESATAQVTSTFNAHTNRYVQALWSPPLIAPAAQAAQQQQAAEAVAKLPGVTAAGIVRTLGDGFAIQVDLTRPSYLAAGCSVTPGALQGGQIQVSWAPGRSHTIGAGQVLLGSAIAAQMYLPPLSLGPTIMSEGQQFQVVGLIKSAPQLSGGATAVLFSTADSAVLPANNNLTALVFTQTGAAQQVAQQLAVVLDPENPSSVQVNAPPDPTTLRAEVQSDVQVTLLALTGVALLAAIVGLANAMVLAVIERQAEFGLRQAVGARARHLIGLVISESCIIGAIGGVLGLVGGFVVILVITIANRWVPVFDTVLTPLALLGGVIVGALGGAVAALRAARVQPSEALCL